MTAPRGAVLAVPAVAGVAALVAATGKGLYVSPDAVFYVGTARNLVDGHGFTPPPGLPPLQHFPPLLTLLLAGIGKVGPDPLTAARVVNALAYGGIVLLVGLVVRARTGSVYAGTVAAVLTACAVDLLAYSASALSEPLFVVLGLAGLLALAADVDRPRKGMLLAAGGLVAAACLTRYVGAALAVAGVGYLLARRRVVDAMIFGALAVVPLVAWLAWAGGQGSDRSLAWHLFGTHYLGQAGRPLARWVLPWPRPPIGLVLALAVVVVGLVLARRAAGVAAGPPSSLDRLLAAFAVAYLALLLADRTVADVTGRLDARFLLPLHVVAILLAVPALHRRKLEGVAVAVAVVQLIGAISWTVGGLTDRSITRRGYNAVALERSTLLAGDYSNAPDGVFFLTGRTSLAIPAKKDYLTGKANPRYADQLAALRDHHGAVLVYLDVPFRRSFQPSRAELEAALPLQLLADDGAVASYRLR